MTSTTYKSNSISIFVGTIRTWFLTCNVFYVHIYRVFSTSQIQVKNFDRKYMYVRTYISVQDTSAPSTLPNDKPVHFHNFPPKHLFHQASIFSIKYQVHYYFLLVNIVMTITKSSLTVRKQQYNNIKNLLFWDHKNSPMVYGTFSFLHRPLIIPNQHFIPTK